MTYVVATRVPRGEVASALFWDTMDPYHYVRLDKAGGELLIVGGEDHKTGQADDPERRFGNLEEWLRRRFPAAGEIAHRWSGQVMETQDYLAFVGLNPGDEHTYVITGDSGMGMTHSTLGAIIITDLVHGAQVPWTELYDPSRIRLKAAPAFAKENANVAWQFADWVSAGDTESAAAIPLGSGAVFRRGLHKIAAYRDEGGTLTDRPTNRSRRPTNWILHRRGLEALPGSALRDNTVQDVGRRRLHANSHGVARGKSQRQREVEALFQVIGRRRDGGEGSGPR